MAIGIEEVDAALTAFGLARKGEPVPVADSILNENVRVETDAGPRFLRFISRKRDRDVIEGEHRAMRYAEGRGIPIALPIETPAGATVADVGSRLVVLFPFIDGRTAQRRAITPGEATALGDMHGRVTLAFREFRDPVLEARASGEITWDTAAAIATLHRIDAQLSSHLYGIDDRHSRRGLRLQLLMLESGQGRPPAEFAHLPFQLDHGDYHERNVILRHDADEVIAVVDWERVRPLPPTFQLVRAVDFIGLLAAGPLDDYLAAYGRHVHVPAAECRDAVEQWWNSVLHSTWAFTVVYEEGDQRAARFLPEIETRLRMLSDPMFRERLAERIAAACGA